MARQGRRRERESLALAVALLVHAAAMLGVREWAKLHPPAAPSRVAANDPTIPWGLLEEVDLDESPAPSVGAAPTAPHEDALGTGRAPSTSGRRKAMASSLAAPAEVTDEPPPDAVALNEHESTTSTSTAPEGREGPIDLGLGPDGWQRWVGVLPNEPAAPRAEARGHSLVRAPPASSTGGLQEGLEASDRKLGMGPGGRVATALFQAAHGADAPETGTALFNVTVLRTGAVEVTLGETTDRRWQSVAARAAEALRQSPPRIPPPREGYRLTLRITAEETLPNGIKRKQLHGAARRRPSPLPGRARRAARDRAQEPHRRRRSRSTGRNGQPRRDGCAGRVRDRRGPSLQLSRGHIAIRALVAGRLRPGKRRR
jgi:hypothetical protein